MITAINKQKIEMVKVIARDNLDRWALSRLKTLEEIEENHDVAQLFIFADDLSDMVVRIMDIEHHLTPQIVAVLSSMVLGITNGTGIQEVENLIKVKDTLNSGLH
jgi:hypothetical protein